MTLTGKFIDDDENIKAMRETAREIGLVEALTDAAVRIDPSRDENKVGALIHEALAALGVESGDFERAHRKYDDELRARGVVPLAP